MTCAKVSELLTDFVLEELPSDLKEKVNEHVQGCAACRSELIALKQVTNELKEMARQIEPPEYLGNQLEQIIVTEMGSPEQSNKWWQPKIIMQVAATFLIAIVGWGLWDNQNNSKEEMANDEAAIVLEQKENQKQPEQQEAETVVQDAQLLQQQASTEPVPQAVEPSSAVVATAPEPKSASVTQGVATTTAPEDMETVEILRTDLVEQEELAEQGDQGEETQKQIVTMTKKTQAIALDTVQQININIMDKSQKERVITPVSNIEAIAMIVEGINNALPLPNMKMDVNEENIVTHIINIQLETGEIYQLNYCQAENICYGEGIFEGELVQPESSLSMALQSL